MILKKIVVIRIKFAMFSQDTHKICQNMPK